MKTRLTTGMVALGLVLLSASPTYASGLKAYAGTTHSFISPTLVREGVVVSDGSSKTNVFLDIDYTQLTGSESLRDTLTDAILTYSSNNSLGLSASDIVWMNGTINSTTTEASSVFHGLMSSVDKVKMDTLKDIQTARVQTDASGNYTWTYPVAFNGGSVPRISALVETSSGTVPYNVQIVGTPTATSTVLKVLSSPTLTVLGINVLGSSVGTQSYLDLMAIDD